MSGPVVRSYIAVSLMFLAASPAMAFNCAKATSEIEKAICADPAALRGEEAMEKAYFSLRKKLDGRTRKLLLNSQRSWLAARQDECGGKGSCLAEWSVKRARDLANGPGGPVTQWIVQKGGKYKYNVKIAAPRFLAPYSAAQRAYNKWLDRLIAKAPLGRQAEPVTGFGGEPYAHEISIEFKRRDKNILSAVADFYDYSGGAHPNSWTTALNLLAGPGKRIDPAKLFPRAALKKLVHDCAGQIVDRQDNVYADMSREKAINSLDREDYPGEVQKHVLDSSFWHFTGKKAVIRFDSYSVGPYAAGPFSCSFSYAELARLAKNPGVFAAP